MMPVFAEPVYFWMLLALLPLFLLRFRAHRLSSKGTPGLVAHRLRHELVIGSTPWLRWLSFTLHSLALTFIVIALARPQWGHEDVASETEGRNIIIAMDTSRSMLATDLLPNRLTRARLAAQDLVDSLPNDRIGLIAFAGRSFLQAPLTMDHMAIVETLNQLDTEIIPRGGTNINSAVTMAIETFQKADSKDNALIIFSDGEDLEGGEELAKIGKDAEELGMVVIAIGVGTEAGSIIPDPSALTPGVFIKNDDGNIVRTRLDPASLQQLSARTSRGLYLNLGSANSIANIVGKALEQIEVSRSEEAVKKRPIERFAWLLSAALLFMTAAFVLPISLRRKPRRRNPIPSAAPAKKTRSSSAPPPLPSAAKSSALALLGFAIFSLSPLQAETPAAKTSDRPALESFQNEDYQAAVNAYQKEIEIEKSASKKSQLQFGLGSAAYRTGDFELAEQFFGKVLENPDNQQLNADAHYNLGNTLFRHGQALLKAAAGNDGANPAAETIGGDPEGTTRQWQAAIEHYQAALEVKPGHPQATQNLKTVGDYLKRLQQQEQEEKQDEEQKDEEKEDEEKEEEKKEDEGNDEDKDKNQDSDDSKGNQPPPEDQDKNKDGDKGDNQDPQSPPSDSEDPDDQKKPSDKDQGKPKDPQDGENKEDGKPQPQPAESEQGKPQEKDPEGNLKAQPNQAQPADAREGKEDQLRNPETGFSPLEARRLLQSLSDEDLSVKPLIRPSSAQPYKNW